jgi:hypothetical protein
MSTITLGNFTVTTSKFKKLLSGDTSGHYSFLKTCGGEWSQYLERWEFTSKIDVEEIVARLSAGKIKKNETDLEIERMVDWLIAHQDDDSLPVQEDDTVMDEIRIQLKELVTYREKIYDIANKIDQYDHWDIGAMAKFKGLVKDNFFVTPTELTPLSDEEVKKDQRDYYSAEELRDRVIVKHAFRLINERITKLGGFPNYIDSDQVRVHADTREQVKSICKDVQEMAENLGVFFTYVDGDAFRLEALSQTDATCGADNK